MDKSWLKPVAIAVALIVIMLLFIFCGREVIGATEPLNIDTASHVVISPTTIDFSTATVLGLTITGIVSDAPFGPPWDGVTVTAPSQNAVFDYLNALPIANWDTAYTDRLKWDGGATGLVAATGRTSLGLVIGTNVQAWDAELDTWATKTPDAGTLTITTAKTLNATNTLTFSGTDGSTLNIGAGGTLGSAAFTSSSNYELALANPATNGYILSSTTGGVRSWIAPPTAPITSVFGRTGAVVAQSSDYASFYEVPLTFSMSLVRSSNNVTLLGDMTAGSVGPSFYYGTNSGGTRGWYALRANAVTSVFGGTGAVTAQSGDYTFAQIGSKPTTLSGYGITDPVALLNVANTFSTGGQLIQAGAAANVPLTLRAAASQSANIFQWQDSAATVLGYINNGGALFASVGRITNLTTNGFVKTTLGNGTLAVDSSTYLTGNQTITLSGDITGSGATAITTTYNNAVPTAKGGLPVGGTAGQLLQKNSATNYDAGWVPAGGGGNVSNSGTPTVGQNAQWTDSTHITGVSYASLQTGILNTFGTTGTGGVMAGLGGTITPTATGKILV